MTDGAEAKVVADRLYEVLADQRVEVALMALASVTAAIIEANDDETWDWRAGFEAVLDRLLVDEPEPERRLQ